jgi:hypothetical protein
VSTDLHDLDKFIGRYVVISEGPNGAAGWLVDVSDDVKYDGGAHRWVALDWGQGWPVRETTEIIPGKPPAGETAPEVENPIEVMHRAMHRSDGSRCRIPALCPFGKHLPLALRDFREWQAKQGDQYWVHHYVKRLKGFLGDPISVGELLRDARAEGAPPHILERMQSMVDYAGKSN